MESGQAWSLHPSIAYGMIAVSTLVAAAILIRFLLRPAEHAATEESHAGCSPPARTPVTPSARNVAGNP
ncbi:hypothetical protein [Nocardiopsis salina]|uniref:hypothetical protein n=1 Tax=Nocardiopsis salina TaxID=245836 RepID=UPI00034770D3|nr:hypothetical protein [Nocardiopsis salina]